MSLFGTSPPRESSSRASDLFADDNFGYGNRTTNSLFDDGDDGGRWAFSGPRSLRPRSSTADLVKSLLRGANVPDEYVDLYDDLVSEEGEVTILTLRRLLSLSGLAEEIKEKILRVVGRGSSSSQEQSPVSRDEFNVFLALVGLAQEGEEDLTIDAVDDRRRALPIPNISSSASSTRALPPSINAPAPSETPSTPTTPKKSIPSPTQDSTAKYLASPPLSVTKSQVPQTPLSPPSPPPTNTMSAPQDDPWGSPELHVGHNHAPKSNTNGFSNSPAAATSSEQGNDDRSSDAVRPSYSTTASQITDTDDLQASLRLPRQPTMNAWGGPPSAGGFVDGGADSASATGSRGSTGFGRLGSALGPGGMRVEEVITVTSLPEKEGMFMFQHRNYQIASARRGSRVVRRYSDFVWLLECLHKRYPFRQLPLLPPKRLAVNGHYLSADNAFIERRRRGLARFANALVRHPVLREETLVVMFLTVPTELAVWRKQATISVQEEFVDKSLPPNLEESLPADLNNTFETVRAGVRRSAETYIQLCNLLERIEKRQEGISADYRRLSNSISSLTDMSEATYSVDTSEIALLNDGLNSVARHYSTAQSLMDDEVKAWDEGVLEDLKRHRDSLVSMRELFERKDRYAVDNIPFLEKRITATENKLRAARSKPQELLKPNEIEKLETSIVADKESIVKQHARGVLIKECIRDELLYFQGSQYQVSRCHQDWAQERIKYAELTADNWKSLVNAVEGMPLGE